MNTRFYTLQRYPIVACVDTHVTSGHEETMFVQIGWRRCRGEPRASCRCSILGLVSRTGGAGVGSLICGHDNHDLSCGAEVSNQVLIAGVCCSPSPVLRIGMTKVCLTWESRQLAR